MEVKQAVDAYLKAKDELKSLAHRQYTPETCPLGKNGLEHHTVSQMLFGEGNWCWECGFCGKEHGDSY